MNNVPESLFGGGHHARFIDAQTPMHLISKTFQSRFLLAPSDELNDVILGVIGRAQLLYPKVALHAFCFMSNHMHAIATGPANELSAFMGFVKREISRRWGSDPAVAWRGGMWGGYVATALPTPQSQLNALKYVLSQGAKEDLVERPQDWPGANTVSALMLGRRLHGHWFDATAFARAKMLEQRKRAPRKIRRADFLRKYEVTLAALPVWSSLDVVQQRANAATIVAEICREALERRRQSGATVMGARAATRVQRDARGSVSRPEWFEHRRRMIVWADPRHSQTRDYLRRYWAFQRAFRAASRALREGARDVEFPAGAFRPGSWCVTSSAL